MAKVKTECAFCTKEIEVDTEKLEGEPRCDECQKKIDEGKEDEIE